MDSYLVLDAEFYIVNEPTKPGVCIDPLFAQSRLYEATKPLIQLIKSNFDHVIARSSGGKLNHANSWGAARKNQFLEHVFAGGKSIFHIDFSSSSLTAMDSQMVESDAAYIAAL